MKYQYLVVAAVVAAAFSAAPSQATKLKLIPEGSATLAILGNPVVTLGKITDHAHADQVQFNAHTTTVTTSGLDSLAPAQNGSGAITGAFAFSQTVGATLTPAAALSDFLVFSDGKGGQFHFTLDSVTTTTFSLNEVKNGSDAISVVLDGLLSDMLGTTDRFTPTDATLTLSFNRTFDKFGKASAWSPTASLAVASDVAAVPEPASWAMMVAGFGALGATMRSSRRRVRSTATFA